MSSSKLVQESEFTIRTYEIDNQKRASVPALINLLHEAAMQNVMALGVSVWDLEPQRLAWVLLRMQVSVSRMPLLGETIRIVTYPAGFERLFTYRDYKVYDATGEMIAWAASSWVLMDIDSRSLARIPAFILEFRNNMPAASTCLPRPVSILPKWEELNPRSQTFKVNWHDLDFNLHATNSMFVQWLIESLPDETLLKGELKWLDVQYRAEVLWKDEVLSQAYPQEDGTFLHRLLRGGNQKELAVGMSKWG